jgi:hypothetical protein
MRWHRHVIARDRCQFAPPSEPISARMSCQVRHSKGGPQSEVYFLVLDSSTAIATAEPPALSFVQSSDAVCSPVDAMVTPSNLLPSCDSPKCRPGKRCFVAIVLSMLAAVSCGAPSLSFSDDAIAQVDAAFDSARASIGEDSSIGVRYGCADTIQDGFETDVDCGGKDCPGCATGLKCKVDSDCVSAYCNAGTCARASCVDKVKNLNETDVDCGGTDCPPCSVGKTCKLSSDCQQGACTAGKCQLPTCDDHVQGPGETDVDCGGPNCAPCAVGKKCLTLGDCVTSVCGPDALCAAPSCSDGVQNGQETGKDCGGTICPKCVDGLGCVLGTDCASGTCTDHVCQMASCNDKILNGNESDVDCGGTCPKCAANATCKVNSDCSTGELLDNMPALPSWHGQRSRASQYDHVLHRCERGYGRGLQ